eukprot:jgi/Tetstr1/445484/TSEL_033262.t1
MLTFAATPATAATPTSTPASCSRRCNTSSSGSLCAAGNHRLEDATLVVFHQNAPAVHRNLDGATGEPQQRGVLLYYKYVDLDAEERQELAGWVQALCQRLALVAACASRWTG